MFVSLTALHAEISAISAEVSNILNMPTLFQEETFLCNFNLQGQVNEMR